MQKSTRHFSCVWYKKTRHFSCVWLKKNTSFSGVWSICRCQWPMQYSIPHTSQRFNLGQSAILALTLLPRGKADLTVQHWGDRGCNPLPKFLGNKDQIKMSFIVVSKPTRLMSRAFECIDLSLHSCSHPWWRRVMLSRNAGYGMKMRACWMEIGVEVMKEELSGWQPGDQRWP